MLLVPQAPIRAYCCMIRIAPFVLLFSKIRHPRPGLKARRRNVNVRTTPFGTYIGPSVEYVMTATRSWSTVACTLLAVAISAPQTLAGGLDLTIALSSAPDGVFDPHSRGGRATRTVEQHIFEPLVLRNTDQQLRPGLAISWEAVDPTMWRFQLRGDVRFHNGSPFTADDVEFSFSRALDMAHLNDLPEITDIVRLDDHTIEIQTPAPNPRLVSQIARIPIVSS